MLFRSPSRGSTREIAQPTTCCRDLFILEPVRDTAQRPIEVDCG